MTITRILLVGVSMLAMAGAAQAADLIVIDEPVVVAPSAHDWSGFYVGGSVGFGMGTVDWTGEAFLGGVVVDEDTGSFDIDGWTVGLQAGANAQFDMFVLGVEGDIAWANISGEGPPIDPGPDATVPSGSIDWIGTLRGRAGIAVDQVLVYGTAGLAIAGGEIGLTNLDGLGDDRTADISATGWTAGFGAEVALDENLSIKGEYLYTPLTTEEVQFGDVLPADFLAVNSDIAIHTFKVGLNLSF